MLEIPAGLRITVSDTRLAGHCVRGVKEWFERHDLDFRAFIANGIDAREFVEKGDGLSLRIVEMKLERERNG